MSNNPLVYTIKKASERIGIDADNFQSLYIEGKLRLAYLNIYNDKPILGYLPEELLRKHGDWDEKLPKSLSKHVKFDLPFVYLSSFALSVKLKYNKEISSPLVEDLKGNDIFLVHERYNQEGLYFTEAEFSLENPIIPLEEVRRYLKTYGQMKIKNNIDEPYMPPSNNNEEGIAIAYFANKFYQENTVLPKPKQLIALMIKSNLPLYKVKQYGKLSEKKISINGIPIRTRQVGERTNAYLREEFRIKK